MKTHPSDRIGRISEEYSLIALLSQDSAQALLPIEKLLQDDFSEEVYCFRPAQRHLTITAIMRDITFGERTRSEFLKREHDIITSLHAVIDHRKAFAVHFDTVRATQDAVIIESPDIDAINGLRTEIIDTLSVPYAPATIAHSTIARFRTETSVESLNARLALIDINFTEHIEELLLVRETIMPLEQYEVIARFSLR